MTQFLSDQLMLSLKIIKILEHHTVSQLFKKETTAKLNVFAVELIIEIIFHR